MTTEQAVKWLKDLNKGLAMPQYEDALNMAIEALQAQADCNTCDKAVRDRAGVIGCAKFDSKPTVAIPHDGDLISRRDAIEFFKDDVYVVNELKNMATVAIPSAEPKWIPVSERLPDDEEDVLFCDLFDHIMLGYHPRDWKSTHFAERGSWELQKNVAAWMPLPKPYEEQERSE